MSLSGWPATTRSRRAERCCTLHLASSAGPFPQSLPAALLRPPGRRGVHVRPHPPPHRLRALLRLSEHRAGAPRGRRAHAAGDSQRWLSHSRASALFHRGGKFFGRRPIRSLPSRSASSALSAPPRNRPRPLPGRRRATGATSTRGSPSKGTSASQARALAAPLVNTAFQTARPPAQAAPTPLFRLPPLVVARSAAEPCRNPSPLRARPRDDPRNDDAPARPGAHARRRRPQRRPRAHPHQPPPPPAPLSPHATSHPTHL